MRRAAARGTASRWNRRRAGRCFGGEGHASAASTAARAGLISAWACIYLGRLSVSAEGEWVDICFIRMYRLNCFN